VILKAMLIVAATPDNVQRAAGILDLDQVFALGPGPEFCGFTLRVLMKEFSSQLNVGGQSKFHLHLRLEISVQSGKSPAACPASIG
jgi:hypothetical protein